MLVNVFISYKTTDKQYVNDVKSISLNPNNQISFTDCSLPEPVKNDYGDVIRRHPDDEGAQPVKDEIYPLLQDSPKLLVIVGRDTHSSGWVEWEIKIFKEIHGRKASILLMRHKDNKNAGLPSYIDDEEIHDWDTDRLSEWLEN